ncbi:hypothetical protein [Salinifilum ghardaiensis]
MIDKDLTQEGMLDDSAKDSLPVKKQWDQFQKAAEGDEVDLSGIKQSVEGLASEALSFASNPASWLINKGLGFLLEWIQPLEEALQLVSGDKESLQKGSEDFGKVKEKLSDLSQEIIDKAESGLKDWNGEAADAARTKLAAFAAGVENTGKQAHNVSELLQISSTLAEAAEGVIRGIIADFVTWLIMTWVSASASAPVTFGSSYGAASAATAVEASVATTKATKKVKQIVDILDLVVNAITLIKAAIDTTRVADAMNDIKEGKDGDGSSAKEHSDDLKDLKSSADTAKKKYEYDRAPGEHHDNLMREAQQENAGTNTGINKPAVDAQTLSSGASKAAGHYGNAADKAADDLEQQADKGGFSDVPSNETIEGQLDV